jgi:hypothetical protein
LLRKVKPCGLCEETSKYRCPKCHFFRYCSVKCWKEHVEECREAKKMKVTPTHSMILPNFTDAKAQGKVVSRHKLYLLERSNLVRQSLTTEIKDIILKVALADEPVKILEKYREEHINFSEFTELLLKAIN